MTDSHRYTAPASAAEESLFRPFLEQLVDAAWAEIMPRFLRQTEVRDKANGTPVTEADAGAERAMRELIEARFPEHGVYGEELGQKPARPDVAGTSYRWILDPVDGTRSFITNSFLFGTLIALERDDGAGFRPILSSLSHAAAGVRVIGSLSGSTMELRHVLGGHSAALRARPCADLSRATLLTTSHWTCHEQRSLSAVQRLIDRVRVYRTMGDCFGYFAVASGGADIMIDTELSYWDVAALLPVVEGAGAVITSLSGGNPLVELSAVCTAGPLHGEVIALLNS